jgi:hypothetical protein
MDFKGRELRHKKFGVGVVEQFDEKYIQLRFADKLRKFACNSVFAGMVECDAELKKAIEDAANLARTESELKKQEDRIRLEKTIKRDENVAYTSVKSDTKNICVNAVYCDGGKNEDEVGFNGVCSDEVLEDNVNSEDERWCTNRDCRCSVYLENKSTSTRRELDRLMEDDGFVCNESRLLRDWVVVAGTDNDRLPVKPNTSEGKLCVLTTVENGCDEEQRYIFALYIIESIDEDVNGVQRLWAESRYKCSFAPKVAKKLLFWDFFYDREPEWGADRFIEIDDETAVKILRKAVELEGGKEAETMLNYFAEING